MEGEARCSLCETGEDVFIIQKCNHLLCVPCAAAKLQEMRPQGGKSIKCQICGALTVLNEHFLSTIEAFELTNSTRFADHRENQETAQSGGKEKSRIDRLLDKLNTFEGFSNKAQSDERGKMDIEKTDALKKGFQGYSPKASKESPSNKFESLASGNRNFELSGRKTKDSGMSEFEAGIFASSLEALENVLLNVTEMKMVIKEMQARFSALALKEDEEEEKVKAREVLIELSVLCKANISSLFAEGICDELRRLLNYLPPAQEGKTKYEHTPDQKPEKGRAEIKTENQNATYFEQKKQNVSSLPPKASQKNQGGISGFLYSENPHYNIRGLASERVPGQHEQRTPKEIETKSQQERVSYSSERGFEQNEEGSKRKNIPSSEFDDRWSHNGMDLEAFNRNNEAGANRREEEDVEAYPKKDARKTFLNSAIYQRPSSAHAAARPPPKVQAPPQEREEQGDIPAINDIQSRLEHLRSLRGESKNQIVQNENDESSESEYYQPRPSKEYFHAKNAQSYGVGFFKKQDNLNFERNPVTKTQFFLDEPKDSINSGLISQQGYQLKAKEKAFFSSSNDFERKGKKEINFQADESLGFQWQPKPDSFASSARTQRNRKIFNRPSSNLLPASPQRVTFLTENGQFRQSKTHANSPSLDFSQNELEYLEGKGLKTDSWNQKQKFPYESPALTERQNYNGHFAKMLLEDLNGGRNTFFQKKLSKGFIKNPNLSNSKSFYGMQQQIPLKMLSNKSGDGHLWRKLKYQRKAFQGAKTVSSQAFKHKCI